MKMVVGAPMTTTALIVAPLVLVVAVTTADTAAIATLAITSSTIAATIKHKTNIHNRRNTSNIDRCSNDNHKINGDSYFRRL